jgi:hypothetical protein
MLRSCWLEAGLAWLVLQVLLLAPQGPWAEAHSLHGQVFSMYDRMTNQGDMMAGCLLYVSAKGCLNAQLQLKENYSEM